MDNNKTTEGKAIPTPTGVFEVDNYKSGVIPTPVTPVENEGGRAVSEKTLKKRLARIAASRLMLVMAVLLSVSAVLTLLRGYFWPFTTVLFLHRLLAAVSAWVLYSTAGKRGGRLLAAAPLYATIASVTGLVFLAVYIFCGMFGKMVLVSGENAEEWVRLIYGAGLWAILPSLACLVMAYCLYLFKRHERFLALNVRDGLRYGFAFEKGYGSFSRSAIILAAVMFTFQIFRGFVDSFGAFGWFPESAVALYDRLFLSQKFYAVNLIGVIIHCGALACAVLLSFKYSSVVKKYKIQREIYRQSKEAEERKMPEDSDNLQNNEELKKAGDNELVFAEEEDETAEENENVNQLCEDKPADDASKEFSAVNSFENNVPKNTK